MNWKNREYYLRGEKVHIKLYDTDGNLCGYNNTKQTIYGGDGKFYEMDPNTWTPIYDKPVIAKAIVNGNEIDISTSDQFVFGPNINGDGITIPFWNVYLKQEPPFQVQPITEETKIIKTEIVSDLDFITPDGATISTQEAAQKAIVAVNNAIISKDKIRAHLGAIQNRLENTISNLNIQAENLQTAESRISDVDVATEMTNFVRNQILTQSSVAMLSQDNTLPQMFMQLIQG